MPATRPAPAGATLAVAAGLALYAIGGPSLGEGGERYVQGPSPGNHCQCRANGRGYEVGEQACIDTPAGPRLALCRMVLNVTSWAVGGESCIS